MDIQVNADVMKAAVASSIGVLSLVCLILGGMALALFRGSPARVKLIVVGLMLVSATGLAFSILSQPETQNAEAKP